MTHELTAQEMLQSLTGYEEIAIAKAFGEAVMDLAEKDKMTFGRSLVFVAEKREGMKDPEAKDAALSLTIKQASEFFADEQDEPMPEDPVSAAGKDNSSPPVLLST